MSVEYQHWLIPSDNAFEPPSARLAQLIESLREGGWIFDVDEKQRWMAFARESGRRPPTRRGAEWNIPIPRPISPDWLAERAAHDLHLSWPMVDPVVKDAFQRDERPSDGPYSLRLEISGRDQGYVYRTSDALGEFESTACPCGEPLEFEIDATAIQTPLETRRIRTSCPACGARVDVSARPATGLDTTRQIERTVLGGISSRFGLAIYCGEDLPYAEKPFRAGAKRTIFRSVASRAVLEEPPGPALKPEFVELCERALGTPLYEVADDNC